MNLRLGPVGQAFTFIGLVLTFSLGVALALPAGASEAAAIPYMYTPMLAALVMMLVVTREGCHREGWRTFGLRQAGLRWWPVAIGAPVVIGLAGLVAAYALPTAAPAHGSIPSAIIGFVIGGAIATVGWTLGEEFGWRGYLLPRLRTLGDGWALVISGVVWAAWHMPIIFLTDLYHADGNRLVVLPLFVLTVMGAAVFIGYLRIASGSVWPATIAHSAHNGVWSLTSAFIVASSPAAEEYVAGDSGIVIGIGTLIAAVLLTWWVRRPRSERATVEGTLVLEPTPTTA